MNAFKIFIVEDDQWYRDVLEYVLKRDPDFEVTSFATGEACLARLNEHPAMITLDCRLPDMQGLEALERIKATHPDINVVIVSGQNDVATAIELLQSGASDYIVKDEHAKDRLWSIARNIREKFELRSQIDGLRQEVTERYNFKNLIGTSPAMDDVRLLMQKALRTDITVSISGETGTGKELVAKGIHFNSNRRSGPFIAVNVSAIPSELIESELFGYEKGAFTGADSRNKGKFEEADKGTLFLDEIGEMDPAMQAKLLRALQEREITRIGSSKSIPFDVRLIVATHRKLSEEVKGGRFREDLYYRLLGLPINLPPLRERGNDIMLLARYFTDQFCAANNLGEITISEGARQKLMKHSYPGNVRELKALMELASVMCSGSIIEAEDIVFSTSKEASQFLTDERPLKEYVDEIVQHFLTKYNNDVLLVAKKLGIGKSTIYRMLKEKRVMNE